LTSHTTILNIQLETGSIACTYTLNSNTPLPVNHNLDKSRLYHHRRLGHHRRVGHLVRLAELVDGVGHQRVGHHARVGHHQRVGHPVRLIELVGGVHRL
jgi:hypothetical protein